MNGLNRRQFLVRLSATSLAGLAGCKLVDFIGPDDSAKLTARPGTPGKPLGPGTYTIESGDSRKGYLLVPKSVDSKVAMPLLLALHGAGGSGNGPINLLSAYAEEFGFFLLAPDSRGVTWDAIRSGFGPDVSFIDDALEFAFDSGLVDSNRIYIEGFSDGASYALGLGPANPELFQRVIAFSAGFITRRSHPVNGVPRIFQSHGYEDSVLPFGNAQQIAVQLHDDGFAVTFVPFQGDHAVPSFIARPAMQWMLNP